MKKLLVLFFLLPVMSSAYSQINITDEMMYAWRNRMLDSTITSLNPVQIADEPSPYNGIYLYEGKYYVAKSDEQVLKKLEIPLDRHSTTMFVHDSTLLIRLQKVLPKQHKKFSEFGEIRIL